MNAPTDAEGFLLNTLDWSPAIAERIATTEAVHLQEAHWQLIYLIRQYHQNYCHAPAMRPLIKYISLQLGQEKGNSIYLLTLFPGSPAKLLAKIAGLPKPPNCL